MLDATTSVAPAGRQSATSRATRPSNGSTQPSSRSSIAARAAASPASQPSSHGPLAGAPPSASVTAARSGSGSTTRRTAALRRGSSQVSSGSTTICSVAASSQFVSTLLVGGAPRRSTTSGRCASANPGDAQQRLVGRHRVRPDPHLCQRVGEHGPAGGGGERRHRRDADFAPPSGDHEPARVARTRATRSVTSSASGERTPGRDTVQGRPSGRPGASDERRARWHQRLPERQVEVHRARRWSARRRDRSAPRSPASARPRPDGPRAHPARGTSAPPVRTGRPGRPSGRRRCRAAPAAGRRCRRRAGPGRGGPRARPGGSWRWRSRTCTARTAGRPDAFPTPSAKNAAERSSWKTCSRSRAIARERRARAARSGSRGPGTASRDTGPRPLVDEGAGEGGGGVARGHDTAPDPREKMSGCGWCWCPGSPRRRRPGTRSGPSWGATTPTRSSRSTCPPGSTSPPPRTPSATPAGAPCTSGYSRGGRLCLRLALDRPDVVAGLVVISGSPGIADAAERATRRDADERLAAELEREGSNRSCGAGWRSHCSRRSPRRTPASTPGSRRTPCRHSRTQLRALGQGVQEPLWDRLGELSVPFVPVAGSLDEKYVAIARRMAAATGVEPVVIRTPGHAVHLEQPDAVGARPATAPVTRSPRSARAGRGRARRGGRAAGRPRGRAGRR